MFDDYPNQVEKMAGGLSPRRITRRERLQHEIQTLEIELNNRKDALQALDDHPELEQFVDTLQKAGL